MDMDDRDDEPDQEWITRARAINGGQNDRAEAALARMDPKVRDAHLTALER